MRIITNLPETVNNLDTALKPIKRILGTMYRYSCGFEPRLKRTSLIPFGRQTVVYYVRPGLVEAIRRDAIHKQRPEHGSDWWVYYCRELEQGRYTCKINKYTKVDYISILSYMLIFPMPRWVERIYVAIGCLIKRTHNKTCSHIVLTMHSVPGLGFPLELVELRPYADVVARNPLIAKQLRDSIITSFAARKGFAYKSGLAGEPYMEVSARKPDTSNTSITDCMWVLYKQLGVVLPKEIEDNKR